MVGVIDRGEPQAEPTPRPSRRRWASIAAGGILAAVLVWGAVWVGANVVYYQPLRWTGATAPPDDGTTYVELLDRRVHVIPAEPGLEFTVGISMTNSGEHPVTVRSVERLAGDDYYVEHLGAFWGRGWFPSLRGLEEVDSLVLEPRESVWIGHRYRYRDCPFPLADPRPLHERLSEDGHLLGGGTWWDDLTVEFSVRGWTRHASLPLPIVPYLDGAGEDCPAGDASASGTE